MADFVLGRLKFKWKGDWVASTAYIVDDIIKFGANTYVCILNHTSGGTEPDFYTDLSNSKWQLHTEGMAFKGEFANDTFYKLNDVVKFGSQQYLTTTHHTSTSSPDPLDTSKFTVYNEGLQWEDSWDNSTFYQDGDVVTYGGYTYIATTNHSGVTPVASATEWDVLTTGFKATGDYNAATAYKTGDTMQFGGWSYVCLVDTSAGETPHTDAAKWEVINEGMKWQGTYDAATTYNKGDTVGYVSSSYIAKSNAVLNVVPGTDAAKWEVIAQGDSNAVLATRGDLLYRSASQTDRLPVGPKGANLTTDGTDVFWSFPEGGNEYYVSNSGADSNDGSASAPFRTIKYALTKLSTNDVVDIKTISGGTGGVAGTYIATGISSTFTSTGAETETQALYNKAKEIVGSYILTNSMWQSPLVSFQISNSTANGFDVTLATSSIAHTYVGSGGVATVNATGTSYNISTANFVHGTGVMTVGLTTAHGMSDGDYVTLKNIEMTCVQGSHIYPGPGDASLGSTYEQQVLHNANGEAGAITKCATIFDDIVDVVANGLGNIDADVANGSTTNYPDARLCLAKNKEFIIQECDKWFTTTYPGFHNDDQRGKCKRDLSYFLDAIQMDLMWDGNQMTNKNIRKLFRGSDISVRVTKDASTVPTNDNINIIDGGTDYAEGDVITVAAAGIGGGADLSFQVASTNVGDILHIKQGVFKEQLPLRITPGCAVYGTTLRGSKIQPAEGTGTQIATIGTIAGGTLGTAGTYKYIHQSKSDGAGEGCVVDITTDGSSAPSITIYHGGYHHQVGDKITISGSWVGGCEDITFTVASVENCNASNMFLLNNMNNVRNLQFKGLNGTPVAGATGKQAVMSLDPEHPVILFSPYIQNSSSVNVGATGMQVDGNVHYKHGVYYQKGKGYFSTLQNDFTQINEDGRGIHCLNAGRAECVSIFTYYCDKAFYATGGGFIRGANCSSSYGEKGAEADGSSEYETPKQFKVRGDVVEFNKLSIVGGSNDENMFGIGDVITGRTSGVSATIFHLQTSATKLYVENFTGGDHFTMGEICDVVKLDTSTYVFTLDSAFGDSTVANAGISGYLIPIKTTDNTLASTGVVYVGGNLQIAGDNTYYRITQVSDEDTANQTAMIKINPQIASTNGAPADTVMTQTIKFSNVRLTGHDFLDIGTGDFTTTNYPFDPTQPSRQEDEVTETNGGRVYYTSTDQRGDFRVGNLFRVQQSTGTATLNADAFDLSGLTELSLGTIGAQLGAAINEFSTDETMAGDSNRAVPVERAIVGYLTRDKMGIGSMVPPTGSTAERPSNAGVDLFSGAIRFNTDKSSWEGYNGSQWGGLGGYLPWDSITGDGSTVLSVVAGQRSFVDTSGGTAIIQLPASPSVGDERRFLDLVDNFATAGLTVQRNGNKIMGLNQDFTVTTDNAAVGIVYTGASYGWKLTENV